MEVQEIVIQSTQVTNYDWNSMCYGCLRYFLPGEAAYICSNTFCSKYLHEECAEMARDIRHPAHPSHTLKPVDLSKYVDTECVICSERNMNGLGYICKESCDLLIHMRCAGSLIVADEEHPQHELKHLKRPSSFECDACATNKLQGSYSCNICDYWIHEGCASLPTTMHFHHHPDHPLSLAFHPPYEYIKYEYTCNICKGALRLRNWVYHCEFCRYIVHIKCATINASNRIKNEDILAIFDKDILKAPIDNIYEEMIKPFVERQRGQIPIPNRDSEYEFRYHNHPLSFSTFSSFHASHDHSKEEDNDGNDANTSERLELTCDGCTMPIEEKSSNHCDGYMSCGYCKYFLHLACFNLPPHLPSHPLHQYHTLSLQSSHKLTNFPRCHICKLLTNGLFYACKMCDFIIDVKCASMPDAIRHAGHSQHNHYLNRVTQNHQTSFCGACYSTIYEYDKYYKCDSCGFSLCCGCVLLPTQNKHRLEKHLLALTYDASDNHPGDFYCNNCEEQMNPKSWMYHCRDCDQFFHPNCFPATSGVYRNFNFGQQLYRVSHHYHHFLRFQIISKKNCCNICHKKTYDCLGYQCICCNFIMCFNHDVIEVNHPIS